MQIDLTSHSFSLYLFIALTIYCHSVCQYKSTRCSDHPWPPSAHFCVTCSTFPWLARVAFTYICVETRWNLFIPILSSVLAYFVLHHNRKIKACYVSLYFSSVQFSSIQFKRFNSQHIQSYSFSSIYISFNWKVKFVSSFETDRK